GGVSTQSSESGSGRPSMRQTKAGLLLRVVTEQPAWERASNPVEALGAQPTRTPPPRSPKSTTPVAPSPAGQASARAGRPGATSTRPASVRPIIAIARRGVTLDLPGPGGGRRPSLRG